MSAKIYSLIVGTFLVLSSASSLWAKPVVFGGASFPPFSVWDPEAKTFKGPLSDLFEKIVSKSGIEFESKHLAQKRVYLDLAKGRLDAALVVKGVPQIEGKVIFGKHPISEISLRIYYLDGKKKPKNEKVLKDKKIIVYRGYGYGGLIKMLDDPKLNITKNQANNRKSAFGMLQKGRGDYLFDYKSPGEEHLAKHPIENIKYMDMLRIELFAAASKTHPDAQMIVDKIDKAIEELKAAGEI